MVKKILYEIIVHEDKCTGCLICQLNCSYVHKQIFSPSEAFIQISNQYSLTPKILFLEGCTHCNQCAQHCLYGALELKEVEQ
ncbi:MAG: hypothetical protein EU529_06705 [Promethearchaeota archaeon]|nr:MAG: hypothetical protein EU529_06705 [Candidatus Lokiarchaeota archaeon]